MRLVRTFEYENFFIIEFQDFGEEEVNKESYHCWYSHPDEEHDQEVIS